MAPVETKDISCVYGKTTAVDRLCLKIPEGSIYGFLGVNGAGKTSTIKMLMGILAPSQGKISIMGKWQKRVSPKSRRHLAYVSQEQFFYPWMKPLRLAKFVRSFYPNWNQDEFETLLHSFRIPKDKTVDEMSGGMKTKLALALALSSQPEVLILDEPTAGLDPVARREFMDLVIKEAREKGRTTFFSSHLVNEVEQCADIIGILHKGKLLHEGPLDGLLEQVTSLSGTEIDKNLLPEGTAILQKDDGNSKTYVKLPGDTHSVSELQARLPSSCQVQPVSLEEVFLAHVAHQAPA